ncbi:MAG: GNAT family N-acetyltransferase [Phreatobacter sp.]|uniref:GNAT family N-acetyltransferase n=1 Tax=Phreatobacter sp. TaxID=1966341 RepID=UPI001A4667D0|nr:GNAT family N-acetyltransferase [Phreatobacter sp.]MBL8567968.1 GNAT family N-acetyltransferase [Phreatobacter sp.]
MADDLTIRIAGPGDDAAIAAMNQAMDRFYRPGDEPDAAGDVVALMERIRADTQLGTQVALAFHAGQPAGIAFFALIHPGRRLGGLLFLKDLFVAEEARSLGTGEAMMRFLARFAAGKGIRRIDLTAEPDNKGAQRFYERLGMKVRPAVFYRLEGEALARLAGD